MVFKSYDYDLKNEIEEYKQCEGDDLYKFLLYKSSADKKGFDCDRCAYAKSVYHELWGFDNTQNTNFQTIHVGSQLILMGMDTMNSFWITFAWCLNKWCSEDLRREIGITKVTTKSAKVLLDNYENLKEIIIRNLSEEIFDKFVLFAKLTHTIGNLVLVPKKIEAYTQEKQTFNMARASKWNDYFDLSLQWILNNNEQIWDEETVNNYFDMFELRDYITEDNKIIPLIKSHGNILNGVIEAESRPQNKSEIVELLDNITSRINRRGKILHAKLNDIESTEHERRNIGQSTNTVIDNKEVGPPSPDSKETRQAKKIFIKELIFKIAFMTVLFPMIVMIETSLFSIRSLSALIVFIIVLLIQYVAFVYLAYWLANKRRIKYLKSRSMVPSNDRIKIERIIISRTTVIVLIVWAAVCIGGLITQDNVRGGNYNNAFEAVSIFYGFICMAATPIIFAYNTYGVKLSCRDCKLNYMLVKERLEKYSEDNISIKVISKIRNSSGEVTGTSEQYVPGRRVFYRQYYMCKYCGKIHYAPYSKDYIID